MSAAQIPCPSCDVPVPPGAAACPACGIRLVGEDAARLWAVNQQISVLRREADSLLASMRASGGLDLVAAGRAGVTARAAQGDPVAATPAPPAYPPYPVPQPYPAPAPSPTPSAGLSGQQVLLGIGALLLLSAVSVFALVAWSLIGVAGQAVILTGVTLGAAGGSRLAASRRLGAAAHTASAIAIGVSALMALAAWSLDLGGARDLSFPTYVAIAGPVLALLWCGYDALTARVWSASGPTSGYLPSAVLALGAGAAAAVVALDAGALVLGVGLLVVAAAVLGLAPLLSRVLPPRRAVLPSLTAVALGAGLAGTASLVLLVTAYDLDLGVVERYAAALALLVVGVLVPTRSVVGLAGPGGLTRLSGPIVPGSASSTVDPAGLPEAPVPGGAPDVRAAGRAAAVVRAVLVGLALGTVLLDVPAWAWVALSVAGSTALVVAALRGLRPVVVRVAGSLAPAAAAVTVLLVEADGRTLASLLRGTGDPASVPVAVEVVLPALWAAACAVLLLRRLSSAPADPAAGTDPAGPAGVRPDGVGAAAAGVVLGGTGALLLAVLHGTWQWTVPAGLAWVVLALVVTRAASVRSTRGARGPADRPDVPRPWIAVHRAGVVAAAYAVVPLAQLAWLDVDGRLQAAGCWVVAAAVAWYAAAPGRLSAGYLSAVLVSVGNAFVVAQQGAEQVELYTLPSALAFAVLGLAQHRAGRPTPPGSGLTTGPALTIALAPSLLVATSGDELFRLLVVVLAGIVVLLIGVTLALRAPVLVGSATLGVVALAQGSPLLAYVPSWVLLAGAGAALLTVGVAWEAAVGQGRRVGRWVHGLR